MKRHWLLDRPYLAMFVLPLGCSFVASLVGSILDNLAGLLTDAYAGGLGTLIAALPCLYFYKRRFRGSFDGSLKTENFLAGLVMLLPMALSLINNLFYIPFGQLTGKRVLDALCLGAAPGVLEEVAFRGLVASNFLRLWREERKLPLAATLTAAVFGAVHLLNLGAGAGMASTLSQAVYAFCIGVLFAAVYFRTGSLLPSIVAHTLVDASGYLCPAIYDAGGVLTDNGFDPTMLISLLISILSAVAGYRLLRPAKRPEILALWEKKWHLAPAAEEDCAG